ncbi:MAG: GntR family transcriptional regulator [Desulfobacteraceae bacterium]|nr:MAG: GntR family transcriptional regulator [Desulfobacteraceae bacterium]
MNLDLPLRPSRHSEKIIIESILNGTYPPGSVLPPERKLAEILNVTRPTIRETLQRLSSEGWVTIRHGKSTEVNNFREKGGMRLLGTMVKYGGYLPEDFILSLMEFRVALIVPIAKLAVERKPMAITSFLSTFRNLDPQAEAFAAYDWGLQETMAAHSGNPIFPMMLNDFASIFNTLASLYFTLEIAREASFSYYENLLHAIHHDPDSVERVVEAAMKKSIEIFNGLTPSQPS